MKVDILESLIPLKCRTWKPIVKEGDGKITVSKFSGQPLLAENEKYPICPNCEKPMQLFVQLNLDELPAEVENEYGIGIVQLFYCTSEEPLCEVDCEAFFPFSKSVLARLIEEESTACVHPVVASDIDVGTADDKQQMPNNKNFYPPKIIVGWETLDDYPNPDEAETLGVELSDEEANDFYDSGYPLTGDKLAGYPMWVQGIEYPNCPLCGKLMRLLFQIDSEDNLPYMFGDVGCAHLTQCRTHKEQLAFAWACS